MASVSVDSAGRARTGDLLLAAVAEQGSATHAWVGSESLKSGADSARNLADAVHFLCALHGRHPGIVDLAAGRALELVAREWLAAATDAMTAERAHLTRLSVAAGPIPSTPGGAGSETAILAQRSALATLAQSDRKGCALGAAIAFAADWAAIRPLLDAAGRKFGLTLPPSRLGDRETLRTVSDDAVQAERAVLFGAQQLALQHRALWDLLEARAQARRDC
ncbi:MAG TPA: hypothetical protein VLK25_02470 [Allosphingosinicella sp.]|nr:hypothetical protein [Allosphingosinicella sp.]